MQLVHWVLGEVKPEDVGKTIERVFRCLAALTEALTKEPGPKFGKAHDAHFDSLAALGSVWERLNQRSDNASEPFEKAACAKEWLIASFEKDAFAQMQALMNTIRKQAAIVTSRSQSSTARRVAYLTAAYTMQTAFVLLHHASHMARSATLYGNSSSSGGSARRVSSSRRASNNKAGKAVGQKAMAALTHGDFIGAVAGAAWAIQAVAEGFRASDRPFHGPAGDVDAVVLPSHDIHVATAAHGLCKYSLVVTQLVHEQLNGSAKAGGDSQAALALPPGLVRTVQALTDSQLLAAAAASVLYGPEIIAEEGPKEVISSAACNELRAASNNVVGALTVTCVDRYRLATAAGPEGRRLAVAMLRMMRHDAVCRLQVGLLDRLAVHAGLGVKLEGGDGDERSGDQGDKGRSVAVEREHREQQGGQEEQGEQGDGWGGRSGLWWIAREEARRGQLVPALDEDGEEREGDEQQGPGGMDGGLGWHHDQVITVTFADWHAAGQLAAEAGVQAQPSPLLTARLKARALESLCRLCRGEGLGGAYAPAQECDRVLIRTMTSTYLPGNDDAALLPTGTARACLPHWLEAAGWAAALMSEAAAAAMGRPPGAEHSGASHGEAKAPESPPAAILADSLQRLYNMAQDTSCGFKTLSAAAQDDVRRRMARCGLAASLDHALRLQFSAQDSDQADATGATRRVTMLVFKILDRLQMLPPMSITGVASSACGGRTEVSSTCATGGTAGGQLGLLLTLSKRAAVLTRALEAARDLVDGPTRGYAQGQERQHILESAADLLVLMAEALGQVGGCSGRVEAAQRPSAMADGEGKMDCGATWREDVQGGAPLESAVCVDEAQEALALAARAASNLAVPLAWQLAEDVAAAAAEEGSAVQLSRRQEFGAAAVYQLLRCMAHWWHGPVQQLPTVQLLACQPHRVLVAACALAAALPVGERIKPPLVDDVIAAVVGVSAHRALSGRVRGWLAQLPLPMADADSGGDNGSSSNHSGGGGGGGGGGDGRGCDACAGCLVGPLQLVVRHTLGLVPRRAAQALALLQMASGEIRRPASSLSYCADGSDATAEVQPQVEGADAEGTDAEGADAEGTDAEGTDAEGTDVQVEVEADGDFHRCAAAMARGNPTASEAEYPVLPDGSRPWDLLQAYRDAQGQLPQPPPPSAPSVPLPRKLLLPQCRAAALPRLRVCSNPRCSNFAGRSEGDLPLKQCSGCRAVRYCGAACQRAHWREGHKAECKELVG